MSLLFVLFDLPITNASATQVHWASNDNNYYLLANFKASSNACIKRQSKLLRFVQCENRLLWFIGGRPTYLPTVYALCRCERKPCIENRKRKAVQAVWPDARIKSSPIFSKSCPKSAIISFVWKWRFCKVAQKVDEKFLGYFCKKICFQHLLKWFNLVTLHASNRSRPHDFPPKDVTADAFLDKVEM